jgi:ATP-dependent RNA helicase SUPV3L1/SUV3
MLNLLGCSKDNFKKLIQKMKYKSYEKNNEIYFQYSPEKEKTKKIFKNKSEEDSPFKVLKNINFS